MRKHKLWLSKEFRDNVRHSQFDAIRYSFDAPVLGYENTWYTLYRVLFRYENK